MKLVRDHFVAVAIDNANNLNVTLAEAQWLADKGGKACTQGMTAFTAGGTFLGLGGGFDAADNLKMLRQALKKFQPGEEPAAIELPDAKDRATIPQPPDGGLVLYVTWKVLAFEKAAKPGSQEEAFQKSVGVDRLWVRKDEATALAQGKFPESLKNRMMRYHTPLLGTAKSLQINLKDGQISGAMAVDREAAPAALRGALETKDGKVTRFDLLMKGEGRLQKQWGFLAGLEAIPEGKTAPTALYFSLADPNDDLARLPPHRTWRALDAYLK